MWKCAVRILEPVCWTLPTTVACSPAACCSAAACSGGPWAVALGHLSNPKLNLASGLPWPNLACPVTMVECESGREEQSAKAGVGQVTHGSYHNVEEAKLAVRCAADAPCRLCPACLSHRKLRTLPVSILLES